MLLPRTILFPLLAVACSIVAEASSHMRSTPKTGDLKVLQVKQKSADTGPISPALKPESSEQFFKKDYPYDKRPVASPFHFGHPYPVVQDSSDYDKDYVKDENSDNGSWKAQEEYDRLRTKLRREKRELAKSLGKKVEEEGEMKDAMKRHAKEAHERDDATHKVDRIKHKRAEDARKREDDNKRRHEREEQQEAARKLIPKQVRPQKPKHDDDGEEEIAAATEETERAMKKLEECKRQLAEARQRLKELMKELEEAKAAQTKANSVLDETMKHELSEKERHAMMKKQVNSESKEYKGAKETYEKQEAEVADLEAKIKVAAAKVKAMRDGEDPSGGVYHTPDKHHKAGAPAAGWLWALVPAIVAACVASA